MSSGEARICGELGRICIDYLCQHVTHVGLLTLSGEVATAGYKRQPATVRRFARGVRVETNAKWKADAEWEVVALALWTDKGEIAISEPHYYPLADGDDLRVKEWTLRIGD